MVTLYTGGRQVEITYANGDTIPFDNIIGIIYGHNRLTIVWKDYTTKTVEYPAGLYRHIACSGCFEIDLE